MSDPIRLTIYTTIGRTDSYGDEVEIEVALNLLVNPGARGNGPSEFDPGSGNEYDVKLLAAVIVDDRDAPGGLTQAELAAVTAYLDSQKAYEAIDDAFEAERREDRPLRRRPAMALAPHRFV